VDGFDLESGLYQEEESFPVFVQEFLVDLGALTSPGVLDASWIKSRIGI